MQDLKYATLATVSRCGMVWFSEDVLSTEMIFENYMLRIRSIPLEESDDDSFGKKSENKEDLLSPTLQVCKRALNIFNRNVSCLNLRSKLKWLIFCNPT